MWIGGMKNSEPGDRGSPTAPNSTPATTSKVMKHSE